MNDGFVEYMRWQDRKFAAEGVLVTNLPLDAEVGLYFRAIALSTLVANSTTTIEEAKEKAKSYAIHW